MQSKIFSDFNKFSSQAVNVDEGVVQVRATVAANASAVVAAVVSMALCLVFAVSQPRQKAIPLPVLWTSLYHCKN